MKKIVTPFTSDDALSLKAGDQVLISGVIYTGRDAAHKRLIQLIKDNQPLPFDVKDQIIYYVGPTPAKPHHVFGSGGPTTSGRMDAYAPELLKLGLRGMIGKGYRNADVKDAIKNYQGVYFGAIGGAGAYISHCIKECEVIAFDDLGTEAIRRLYVEDLPVTVLIDCQGNDLYELGRIQYLKEHNYGN
ncbi:MAG: Fe-S-containing hydro-lyase [Erysipelotrichaceae bacterium]|nr:Fe-S-containing hydro-lyase [Erysipelotrichaceae bacterium]